MSRGLVMLKYVFAKANKKFSVQALARVYRNEQPKGRTLNWLNLL
jgi:hypothetical protein